MKVSIFIILFSVDIWLFDYEGRDIYDQEYNIENDCSGSIRQEFLAFEIPKRLIRFSYEWVLGITISLPMPILFIKELRE